MRTGKRNILFRRNLPRPKTEIEPQPPYLVDRQPDSRRKLADHISAAPSSPLDGRVRATSARTEPFRKKKSQGADNGEGSPVSVDKYG